MHHPRALFSSRSLFGTQGSAKNQNECQGTPDLVFTRSAKKKRRESMTPDCAKIEHEFNTPDEQAYGGEKHFKVNSKYVPFGKSRPGWVENSSSLQFDVPKSPRHNANVISKMSASQSEPHLAVPRLTPYESDESSIATPRSATDVLSPQFAMRDASPARHGSSQLLRSDSDHSLGRTSSLGSFSFIEDPPRDSRDAPNASPPHTPSGRFGPGRSPKRFQRISPQHTRSPRRTSQPTVSPQQTYSPRQYSPQSPQLYSPHRARLSPHRNTVSPIPLPEWDEDHECTVFNEHTPKLALVPEFDVFQSPSPLATKTVRRRSPKGKRPPPTPLAPRIKRYSSLCEDKLLVSLDSFHALSIKSPRKKGRFFDQEFSGKEIIGEGNFCHVYRARDRKTGSIFAVKRSKRPFKSKHDRSEYLREMSMVSELGVHDNIVTYYRAWQQEQHFYIQMEFCGGNLAEYLKKSPRNNAFYTDLTLQLAQGLHHIHSRDLLHLDLKPENILVSCAENGDATFKLGDFGQARLKGAWQDGLEGDSIYMAPELLTCDGGAQTSADIFSLGLLLFEVVTGTVMPSGGDLWHDLRSGQKSEGLKLMRGKISEELRMVIMDMLHPDPIERPTAARILRLLR